MMSKLPLLLAPLLLAPLLLAPLLLLGCDPGEDSSGGPSSNDGVVSCDDTQVGRDPCNQVYPQPGSCSFDFFGDDESGIPMKTDSQCVGYVDNAPPDLNNYDVFSVRTYNNCDDSCGAGARPQFDAARGDFRFSLDVDPDGVPLAPSVITHANSNFEDVPGVLIEYYPYPISDVPSVANTWACVHGTRHSEAKGTFTVTLDEVIHDGTRLVEVHGSLEATCPAVVGDPDYTPSGFAPSTAAGNVTLRADF